MYCEPWDAWGWWYWWVEGGFLAWIVFGCWFFLKKLSEFRGFFGGDLNSLVLMGL